ncbi:hypothetical protein LINPERPRIM_LOCUS32494, partial [Linum perenne]
LHLASIPRELFTEGPAHIIWTPQSGGIFTVSSLRRVLVAKNYRGFSDFPSDVISHSAIPSKIACLCWKIYFRKLATNDNLQRRGFHLANRCVLCNSELESMDHLFLNCTYASEIWTLLSSKLSIHGPFQSSVVGFIIGWKGLNCTMSFSSARKVLLHAVLWFIWKERNDRIFRDSSNPPSLTFRKLWFAVGDWLLADGSFLSVELSAWRRLVFDNG